MALAGNDADSGILPAIRPRSGIGIGRIDMGLQQMSVHVVHHHHPPRQRPFGYLARWMTRADPGSKLKCQYMSLCAVEATWPVEVGRPGFIVLGRGRP